MKKLLAGIAGGSAILLSAMPALAKVERVYGPWELTAPQEISFKCGGGTYVHTLDTVDQDGMDFEGTGYYNPNHGYTWDMTGNVDGNDLHFTLVYTGLNKGYTLHGTGVIAEDGSVSGTTVGNCQSFTMGPDSAVRFMGNHGQYVRMQEDKMEAAHSRVGMPVQSMGHME